MSATLDNAIARLRDLVAHPTVSSQSNLALIETLADRLEGAGATVEIVRDATGTKASLWGRLGPEAPGAVLLSGHTDVVPVTDQVWASDPFSLSLRDGRAYGRGTCDMKGFIAAVLAVMSGTDPARLRRPFNFAFTYDEEVGCLGARQLVDLLRGREILPEIAIIGEPTGMRIIEGHKGCNEYTTRFTGVEGHGSAPEKGVNAAEYAARYVSRLLTLRDELRRRTPEKSRFDPPWSTINVGRVAGGIAHNVIAGHAEVEWETRPVQASDADFVKQAMAACQEKLLSEMQAVSDLAMIDTQVIGEVAGLEPMEENAARDLIASLTGANGAGTVAFGTEAGLFQSLGMAAVVCGPGEIDQAHKPDEYLEMAQLDACIELIFRLVDRAQE